MKKSTKVMFRKHGWRIDGFIHNYLYFVFSIPMSGSSVVILSWPPDTYHTRRRHLHADLRRFPGIQSPLPHPRDGRLYLRQQGHVPRHPSPGVEKLEAIFQYKVETAISADGDLENF
jgi:hypothetical protein